MAINEFPIPTRIVNLNALDQSVADAATSAAASEAARDAAAASATAADDDATATAADRVQTGLDRVATGADVVAAAGSETSAAASAVLADARADDAASFAGYRDYQDVATLLANTSLTYSAGDLQVAAGDVIRTRAEGFSYEVAASAATDQHVTTAGGVKLYVLPGNDGKWPLAAFGAILDGVANDSLILRIAIDAVKIDGIRDAPPVLVVPPGKALRLTTSCVVDGGSVILEGYGASLIFGTNLALDVGAAAYLSNITLGNYAFILRGFICSIVGAGDLAIRNRGYRKLWIDDVHCLGGNKFLDTEGAFAGSGMRRCRIQSTAGATVTLKQRNNNWTFDNTAITGAGGPGVHLLTAGAELKGVQWVGRNDIEGSAGGILVQGQVSVLGMDGLWFENNTGYNIRIENTSGTNNKDAISITRCNITGVGADVVIGTDAAGLTISGIVIEGNEFADSDLVILGGNKVTNCRIGPNQMNGTSVYNLPTQTGMINDQVSLPVYRTMPMHVTPPAVPFGTTDTKGVLGESRWEAGTLWLKTSEGWVYAQLGQQQDSTSMRYLATGATPTVVGQHKVLTGNAGATSITSFTGGRPGQELVLVGLDGGNTTITHGTNIRLAGGANFTIGDNDVIVLICRNGTIWAEVSRSNNT